MSEEDLVCGRERPMPEWVHHLQNERDRYKQALETLARWPLEKTRFEAERLARDALEGPKVDVLEGLNPADGTKGQA